MELLGRVHARVVLVEVPGVEARRMGLKRMVEIMARRGEFVDIDTLTAVHDTCLDVDYGIYETGDGQLLLVERDDDTSYGYPLESGD